jgi:hypothetical protein
MMTPPLPPPSILGVIPVQSTARYSRRPRVSDRGDSEEPRPSISPRVVALPPESRSFSSPPAAGRNPHSPRVLWNYFPFSSICFGSGSRPSVPSTDPAPPRRVLTAAGEPSRERSIPQALSVAALFADWYGTLVC